MYTSRPCALGRKQSNEGPRGLGEGARGGRRVDARCLGLRAAPGPHSSSCFIRCERRVPAGFRELDLASDASLKNLKMDGKLFQDVSS